MIRSYRTFVSVSAVRLCTVTSISYRFGVCGEGLKLCVTRSAGTPPRRTRTTETAPLADDVKDPSVTDLGSLVPPVLFYARGGLLGGGNILVDA